MLFRELVYLGIAVSLATISFEPIDGCHGSDMAREQRVFLRGEDMFGHDTSGK